VTFETDLDRYEEVTLGLRGRHQVMNASLAIRLAESEQRFQIPRAAIIQGLEVASHAGRLELWEGQPPLLFDGAHNPAGARALRDYLDEFITVPLTLVFGAMRDKDLSVMTSELFPVASRLVLTQPENTRAAPVAELTTFISEAIDQQTVIVEAAAGSALRRACAVTPPEGLICITGSLYLIGEIQTILSQTANEQFANWKPRH
jgi:dihydrofolate synthase/folylpolyglutamate synthase